MHHKILSNACKYLHRCLYRHTSIEISSPEEDQLFYHKICNISINYLHCSNLCIYQPLDLPHFLHLTLFWCWWYKWQRRAHPWCYWLYSRGFNLANVGALQTFSSSNETGSWSTQQQHLKKVCTVKQPISSLGKQTCTNPLLSNEHYNISNIRIFH